MRCLFILPALVAATLATAAPLAAQDLPAVPNASFASVQKGNGHIAWWSPGGWGAPGPEENLAPQKADGLTFAKIAAVEKGAAGWVSPRIPADALRDGFRLTFKLRASADYAGNTPWVFLFCSGADSTDKTAIRRIDISPRATRPDEWQTLSRDIKPGTIPGNATRLSINLATKAASPAGDSAAAPAGWIGYTDIRIEPLGGAK
ncbi:hypothetical protein OpiT1DRAFT_03479 [Opitutaceae bacterium TAV1]|nr:hypothetical protein OpiT1DRAFT_03479 [Opitutaceae bacterium TAV1]